MGDVPDPSPGTPSGSGSAEDERMEVSVDVQAEMDRLDHELEEEILQEQEQKREDPGAAEELGREAVQPPAAPSGAADEAHAENEDDLCPDLPIELARRAKAELNETRLSRPAAIKELRKLFDEIPAGKRPLVLKRYEAQGHDAVDRFLLRFLRSRKMNAQRAFDVLVRYDRFIHKNDYVSITAESVQQILDARQIMVLPTRDASFGSRILAFRWKDINLRRTPMRELLKAVYFVMEDVIQEDEVQICGTTWIEDCRGMRSGMDFDMQAVKMGLEAWQDGYPARFKGLYMLNEPWYFDVLWGILRPFVKKKFRKRLRVLGQGYEAVHDIVGGAQQLPAEFEGTLKFDQQEDYVRLLVESGGSAVYVPWNFRELSVASEDIPESSNPARFGMEVALRGIVNVTVRSVRAGSLAELLGVERGDVLLAIGKKDVLSIKDVKVPKKLKEGLKITVWRRQKKADGTHAIQDGLTTAVSEDDEAEVEVLDVQPPGDG